MTSRKSLRNTKPKATSTTSAKPQFSVQSAIDTMNQHMANFRQKTNNPDATTMQMFGAMDKGTYDPMQEAENAMLMPIHNDVPPREKS